MLSAKRRVARLNRLMFNKAWVVVAVVGSCWSTDFSRRRPVIRHHIPPSKLSTCCFARRKGQRLDRILVQSSVRESTGRAGSLFPWCLRCLIKRHSTVGSNLQNDTLCTLRAILPTLLSRAPGNDEKIGVFGSQKNKIKYRF
jgi:hypothetical protein